MELLVPILITLIVVVVFALAVLSLIRKLVSGNTTSTRKRPASRNDSPGSEPTTGDWYGSDYGVRSSAAGTSQSPFGGGEDFGGGGAGGSFEGPETVDGSFDADFDSGGGGGDFGDGGGGDSGNSGSGE